MCGGDGGCISVASFNLLAPAYVRPLDLRTGEVQAFAAFEWAEPAEEVLAWDKRAPRLLAELRACGADVICLQELQLERDQGGSEPDHASAAAAGEKTTTDAPRMALPVWLRPMLEEEGYSVQLPPAAECEAMAARNVRVLGADVCVCNGLLWRRDRLSLVAQASDEGKGDKDTATCVALCVRGRDGTELAALPPTVVVSVHLDATSEKKRVGQVARCLRRGRTLAAAGATGPQPMTIIAGDMNTEILPGSCVGAFLTPTLDAGAGAGAATAAAPTEEQLTAECASALRLELADTAPSAAQLPLGCAKRRVRSSRRLATPVQRSRSAPRR